MTLSEGKRKIPKAKTNWPVTLKHSKGQVDGVMTIVTPNDAFIRCERPLKLNEVCWMSIKATRRSFEVKGVVIWSNIHGQDDEITPRGMRVRFLKITSQDRMLIADFLDDQNLEKVADDYLRTLKLRAEDIST